MTASGSEKAMREKERRKATFKKILAAGEGARQGKGMKRYKLLCTK